MSASRTVTRIADQDDAVAGKVPVALGGTGAGDAATARANLGLGPGATYVLSLLGGGTGSDAPNINRNQSAKHSGFWVPPDTPLGTKFLWNAWVKPIYPYGGYFISDGYGGAHALLWGFGSVPGAVTGNFWTGSLQSFSGTYTVAVGEWAHLRVLWDGAFVYTYVNGVCDGVTAVSGTRACVPASSGAGVLYVGGSDHLNFGGSVAALWGWDRGQSVDSLFTINHEGVAPAFVPSRVPVYYSPDSAVKVDFVTCYSPGIAAAPDLSPIGFISDAGTVASRHPGAFWNCGGDAFGNAGNPVGVLPLVVADPDCPFGQAVGSALPTESIPSPASVPVGAKVFDSFGRRNQTFAFQSAPTLGSTEGGSLGALAWSQGMAGFTPIRAGRLWGILGGAAAFLDYGPSLAWVECGTADVDVRVTRQSGGATYGETGIAFRVVDQNNGWFCYLLHNSGVYLLRTGTYVAGSYTSISSLNLGATLAGAALRVVTSGTSITIYTGSGSTWTSQATIADSTHLTATKHGLCNDNGATFGGSQARYSNFTVF